MRLSKDGKKWRLLCEPHVATRVKRVFPKAKPSQKLIELSAIPETTEELRWFLQRYPLEMDERSTAELNRLAEEHNALRRKVTKILSGTRTSPLPTMVFPPRPYQAATSELAHVTGRVLCADELGLGKTVTAMSLLARDGALPAAVVVPTHLPSQWAREIQKFLPGLHSYTVQTTSPEREKCPPDVNVWIVPYSRLAGWAEHLRPVVRTVVFDEAHELRREGSAKYGGAQILSSESAYRIGLTATPIWNYGGEFYSVLGVVAPGELGTWEEFTREWCNHFHDPRKARIHDPVAFGSWLREQGIMVRNTRREVGRQLPPIVRSVVDVVWSDEPFQEIEDAVVQLATRTLTARGRDAFLAAGDLDARIRMATGIAKAPAVAALVNSLVEDSGEQVVLFGWHRSVYDVWMKALSALSPTLYTGTEDAKKKDESLRRFIDGESRVLIMSIRSGQGIDGIQDVCHRAVFGELDWSYGAMEQALGRVHRDGQDEPTMAYYPVCGQGSDPIVLDVLDIKRWQQDGVVDPEGKKALDVQTDPDHVKRLATEILRRRGLEVPSPLETP